MEAECCKSPRTKYMVVLELFLADHRLAADSIESAGQHNIAADRTEAERKVAIEHIDLELAVVAEYMVAEAVVVGMVAVDIAAEYMAVELIARIDLVKED